MKHVFFLLFLPLLLTAQGGMAQTDPVLKFGDVPAETFTTQPWLADSSANAVFLFDKGAAYFQTAGGGFDVAFERHARIHLINKNAFGLAEMVLSLFKKGARSVTLDNFKGATYNLENGKVKTTKVDKSNIFKEQNGDYTQVKIAFPNVREGSVIEFTYRLIYPGYGFIPSWHFQGDYPVLWSEYELTFPSLFNYIIEKHGYLRYTIDTTLLNPSNYSLSIPSGSYGSGFSGTWRGNTFHHIWAMQNVPALVKKEAYTTTLSNHVSRIDFQLAGIQMAGYQKSFTSSWSQLAEELMARETFGSTLKDHNRWMDDVADKTAGPDKNSPAAARNIYNFMRDSFSCNNVENLYLSQPLKKTWEDKKGAVADINLLLTALYLHLGFEATPVILSSRAHGIAYEAYPLLKEYNYVITRVRVGDNYYLLDASKDYLVFGQLPELCYNGYAWTIEAKPIPIQLWSSSITEKRNTTVVLRNSDTAGYSGRFYHTAGIFESMEMRDRLKRMKKEAFFEAIHKTMPPYKTMGARDIDTLDTDGGILAWHYDMKYNFKNDRIYLNPIFHERMSANPFIAPDRYYPVEMPWLTDYVYSLEMDVPKGYDLDEAPKQERLLLDDGNGGFFDYLMQVNGRHISFSYHLVLKKTGFAVTDYPELRDFFARIVNKQKEELIFKKTN